MPNRNVELSPEAAALTAQISNLQVQAATERKHRITAVINGLVSNMQLTATEAPAALTTVAVGRKGPPREAPARRSDRRAGVAVEPF